MGIGLGELLQALFEGLTLVLAWPAMGYLLVGVVIGLIGGVLPGVGGIISLAILIPFTFGIDPAAAFALLLAVATVNSNSSDFTAILFGVPGDGGSASLIVDGYPMTKNGEAGRALSANLLASLIGAAVGAFSIVLAVPIVRPLVLAFGAPEFLMLCLLGLSFVASLSVGATSKGVASALLGLLLALVGQDPQLGVLRYTFGQLHLWDGLALGPVALGLFALPELYDLSVRRTSIARTVSSRVHGVWQGVKDCYIHFWLIIRCSLIGTFIGILPGLGITVSQWTSYAHAVQSSPNKERFGHGAVEGTLGPGAANNSGLGGTLIPTFAFGVPGSIGAALILGAFMIHGITPGRDMLTIHLPLTMSFVWTIVIANVIVAIVCFPIIKHMAKITFVRAGLVVPVVTILVFLGAFAFKNSLLDIVVTLVFGCIGLAMVRLGWPRPPLILGLVLGALIERYLVQSYALFGYGFVIRPGVVLIAVLIVLVLLYPQAKAKLVGAGMVKPGIPGVAAPGGGSPAEAEIERATEGEGAVGEDVSSRRVRPPLVSPNSIFGLLMLSVGVGALWFSRDWPFQAQMAPRAVAMPLTIVVAAYLTLHLLGLVKESRGRMDHVNLGRDVDPQTIRVRSVITFVWLLSFALSIWALGFVIGGPLMALAYLKVTGRERWLISIIMTSGVALLLWSLDDLLHIPFPRGVLLRLLGV